MGGKSASKALQISPDRRTLGSKAEPSSKASRLPMSSSSSGKDGRNPSATAIKVSMTALVTFGIPCTLCGLIGPSFSTGRTRRRVRRTNPLMNFVPIALGSLTSKSNATNGTSILFNVGLDSKYGSSNVLAGKFRAVSAVRADVFPIDVPT